MSGLTPEQVAVAVALRHYLDHNAPMEDVAEAVVDMRATFTDKHGEPDWAGRSYDYRMAVREAFHTAGLTPQHPQRERAMSLLRYHIGNVVRERLPEEEVANVGLLVAGPKERHLTRRHAEAEELRELREYKRRTKAASGVSA